MQIPNHKLLTEPWPVIARDILRPVGTRNFINGVIKMAKAFGEINRYYSKKLTDDEFKILMKRMTELRKIVKKVETDRKIKGKGSLIPWEHLEYLFSGEDRKDMKR